MKRVSPGVCCSWSKTRRVSEGFSRLLSLRLEAGQLAGVDVRALRFALESLAPGTVLDGAQIEIEEPPGQAWCMGCGADRGDRPARRRLPGLRQLPVAAHGRHGIACD